MAGDMAPEVERANRKKHAEERLTEELRRGGVSYDRTPMIVRAIDDLVSVRVENAIADLIEGVNLVAKGG